MPIYEFKCLKCEEIFELLTLKNEEKTELKCPKCKSEDFERVLSNVSYSMNGSSGKGQGASAHSRKCSSGSCTTYDIPGPNK